MPLNKSDTVMRINKSTSQTADQSQFGQTLTSYGSGAYLDPSAETALDGSGAGREITVRFQASSGTSGYLVYHGSTGGTVGYRVYVTGGALTFTDSSGDLLTVTLPSVSASFEWYTASINTRPWPFSWAASNAHITEISIYNEAQTKWTMSQTTHAVGTISASDVFSYHGQWNGSYLVGNWGGGFSDVRVGKRFKSSTEVAIDFSNYTPSTPTSGENQADPPPVFDNTSELGNGGSVAGPVYALAGATVRDSARRMLSPLVNTIYRDPTYQGFTSRMSSEAHSTYDVVMLSPGGAAEPTHGDGVSGYPEVCRVFDGSSEYFQEENGGPGGFQSDLQGSDATISCWVKCDTLSANMVVYGITGGGGASGNLNDCAVLTIDSSGDVSISWHTGSGSTSHSVASSTTPISTGTWHHIAVRLEDDGGGNYIVAVYVDGTSVASGTKAHPDLGSSSVFMVGARDNNGTLSEYFDGSIAEICIRGTLLTPGEINSEAEKSQGYLYHGSPTADDSTLAHFRLRQPSDGYAPALAFLDVDLGGSTYRAHLDTLCRRPVPDMAGRFAYRFTATGLFDQPIGGAYSADAASVAIVATNKQPGKITFGGPPAQTVYATAALTADGTEYTFTGTDEDLPRDADGCCWFYLATRINSSSPSGHTGVSFGGLQIVPYSKTLSTSYPLPFASP